MVFDVIAEPRGRGFWKMNTSHLMDPECVQKINQIIDIELKGSELLPVKERWELLKLEVAKYAQEFAKKVF